jgi:hypothetical protein
VGGSQPTGLGSEREQEQLERNDGQNEKEKRGKRNLGEIREKSRNDGGILVFLPLPVYRVGEETITVSWTRVELKIRRPIATPNVPRSPGSAPVESPPFRASQPVVDTRTGALRGHHEARAGRTGQSIPTQPCNLANPDPARPPPGTARNLAEITIFGRHSRGSGWACRKLMKRELKGKKQIKKRNKSSDSPR